MEAKVKYYLKTLNFVTLCGPQTRPTPDVCDSRADGSPDRLPAAVGGAHGVCVCWGGVPRRPTSGPGSRQQGGTAAQACLLSCGALQVQGKERMCSGPH